MERTGKSGRSGLVAAAIALVALLALGGLAAADKKAKKMPRGPYPPLGCQVFPASKAAPGAPSAADQTAWNQDVSQAPLAPNSAAVIAYINAHGGDQLHPDFGSPREYGFPYAVTGRRQKRTSVRFTAYGEESDHGRYRVPLKALVEGGQRSDGDRHVLSIDRKRCRLQELYRAFPRKRPKPAHWDADSGVIWNLRSAGLRPDGWTSADAAGLPLFPGLVRRDEARRGSIDHAIRVTFASTRDAWIHPATHCAGETSDPNAPAMGTRLRLGAGYDLSGFSGDARVIAVALKRYGVIVADNGSNWFISGTSDRRWSDEKLDQLKAIPGTAFEVVRSAAPAHVC
jgi:hypothetical protein